MKLQFPKVLVIDDDESFGDALSTWLADLGYQSAVATTASDAAARLGQEQFAAILLDLHLPDIPGHAVLRQLHRSGTDVPVVVMSGSAAMDDVVRAWRENAADFLKKPFEMEQLSAALDRALKARAKQAEVGQGELSSLPVSARSGEPSQPAAPATGVRVSARAREPGHSEPGGELGGAAREASTPEADRPTRDAQARAGVRPAVARLREELKKGTAKLAILDPQVARLQELLTQEDMSMQKVAAAVGRDGALTAGVLRIANSAHYSRGTPVESLLDACVRIGPKRVVGIALELALKNQFSISEEPFKGVLHKLWRNSVVTSRAAGTLSRMLSRKDADDIQVAALLHNIGEQVCIRVFAEVSRGPDQVALDVVAEEVAQKHEDFGYALATTWKLPPLAVRLAGYHHRPPKGKEPQEHEQIRHIVLLAWKLAVAAGFSYLPGQDEMDLESSRVVLGLEQDAIDTLLGEMGGWKV